MFLDFKTKLMNNFQHLESKGNLLYVDINRDTIFELYLDGFEESIKQEYNCNCCKQFLRQFGGIVTIDENYNMISIWDNLIDVVDDIYRQSILNLRDYIHSLPITKPFVSTFKTLGTDKNYDSKNDIWWNHFYLDLPSKYIKTKNNIGEYTSLKVGEVSVFKRGLEELSIDSLETVLELINQDYLHKGIEYKKSVGSFLNLRVSYESLSDAKKVNFAWKHSMNTPEYVTKIQSQSIGTLLLDISNGRELNSAIESYERKVCGANYKRKKQFVTSSQAKRLEAKINDLGYSSSLKRRLANESDIDVSNMLFVHNSSEDTFNIFEDIVTNKEVNTKSLKNVQDISIGDFITNVLPTAKSIDVLVENNHLKDLTCLITSTENNTPSLFKWDNPFSWSKTGGVTDSIKEKVKNAGGQTDAYLRVSLAWSNYDDLDLHAKEPNGTDINYTIHRKGKSRSITPNGGQLDVDMNAGSGSTREPVENITWCDMKKALNGIYEITVHNYAKRETNDSGFIIEVEFNGTIYTFKSHTSPNHQQYSEKLRFSINKEKGTIDFISTPFERDSSTLKKWNIETNQFHKVHSICLSPNYWSDLQVGHKHYMFMLENCRVDENETILPFFNEFLRNDFKDDGNAFEVLATKLQVKKEENQLSGLSFSATQRNSIIVRVNGKTQRHLKINF